MTGAPETVDASVIVVGAGPVGLLLAAELCLGGVDVLVLERLAAPTTESRASTLHARTMELFDQRGLLDRMGEPPRQPAGHFGGLPLDLSAVPSRYPGLWKVPQRTVERVLGEWAVELGARIRREHEVVDVAALHDRCRVTATTPDGRRQLTAHWVVGCDGEAGSVRPAVGIPLEGNEATRELLRADVTEIDVPDRRFERLPGGLAIAARGPGGVTRVMMSELDRPAVQRSTPATFEDVAGAWARLTGEDIAGGRALWVNAFDNASLLAQRYRQGRVLLAGDAAHRQMPVGGQAMNLGLQDAMNLGWKLAAVVRGDAPDGLLDSYHEDRHVVGRRVLGNIAAQSLLLLGGAEVTAVREVVRELIAHPRVRDHLAGTISGVDVRYGDDPHPLVGARCPHLDLVTADAVTSTTALLRAGQGLLLDLTGDASRRTGLEEVTSGWPALVRPVFARGPSGAPATLLLRPDGHVGWVGDRHGDPRPALRRWFGAPIQHSIMT